MTKTTNNTTSKAKIRAAKSLSAAERDKPGSRSIADALSDVQLVALSTACQREDKTIAIPEGLEHGAIAPFATSMIDLGLAEETPAGRGQPVWRQDEGSGEPITLRITDQTLIVLGVDEGNATTATENSEISGPAGEAPASSDVCDEALQVNGRLNAAARASKANVAARGAGTSIVGAQAQPRNIESAQPRAGSKQGQLIAMLSCEEGASIAEIATALCWLPHTTRAALTGLRQKGYELGRQTTVGERGSIYRITALPTTAPAPQSPLPAEGV